MLTENYIYDALEAEREGVQFPIEFDDIWESFGYSRKYDTERYLLKRSGLKKYDRQGFCQLALCYNQSADFNKISLSVASMKFALARANTEKGEQYLIYLIEVEQKYIESLNRALLSEPNPEVEALKQRVAELEAKIGATISDRLEFPYSSKQLHRDSRIASHSYVVGAIKRDFIEGQDYQVVENELFMTEQMYLGFMLSFRSEKGADISVLPDTLLIITKFFFQFQQARSKKNARVAQSDKYKQMELLEYN